MDAPVFFLIDDDIDDHEIFALALSEIKESAKCIFATDGFNGIEKLNINPSFVPDFIFIDMNMPRMNGLQCLSEIRKINRLENVPIFMYSTSADPKVILECEHLGASGFIKKQIHIADLQRALSRILSQTTVA